MYQRVKDARCLNLMTVVMQGDEYKGVMKSQGGF